jgi:hypothetical protein
VEFLEKSLSIVFQTQAQIDNVYYFIPDSVALFPPFSSVRSDAERIFLEVNLLNQKLSYCLQSATRERLMPKFKVRLARVEDCDDLLPIFTRNKWTFPKCKDNSIADLIKSVPGQNIAMVAEYGYEVVGFMNVTRDINYENLAKNYNLDAHQTQNVDLEEFLKGKCMCIDIFCLDAPFQPYASNFVDFAFQHFEDVLYCLISFGYTHHVPKLCDGFCPVAPRRPDPANSFFNFT